MLTIVIWSLELLNTFFFGYQPSVKGYKVRNPRTQKVVLSKNVIFNDFAISFDNLSCDAPVEGKKVSV
jgi:hypothetical protein